MRFNMLTGEEWGRRGRARPSSGSSREITKPGQAARSRDRAWLQKIAAGGDRRRRAGDGWPPSAPGARRRGRHSLAALAVDLVNASRARMPRNSSARVAREAPDRSIANYRTDCCGRRRERAMACGPTAVIEARDLFSTIYPQPIDAASLSGHATDRPTLTSTAATGRARKGLLPSWESAGLAGRLATNGACLRASAGTHRTSRGAVRSGSGFRPPLCECRTGRATGRDPRHVIDADAQRIACCVVDKGRREPSRPRGGKRAHRRRYLAADGKSRQRGGGGGGGGGGARGGLD